MFAGKTRKSARNGGVLVVRCNDEGCGAGVACGLFTKSSKMTLQKDAFEIEGTIQFF